MLLRELFESGGKHITFCFGRFNPPTIGHKQLFDVMSKQGGDVKIFTSQSQDPKKNPLDYSTKIKFLKLIVPEYANTVVDDASLNTVVKVASHLYDQGYRDATFVAGSDRLEDMKKLLVAYNGVEGKSHGYYKFDVLDFASSGEREDGAEGVAGVSASSARAAAATGNLEKFAEATGAGQYAEPLYDAVRKGMGISESIGRTMKAKEFIPAEKPRNFVAKNAKMGGAGQHKDKKKSEKQGDFKHKKEKVPMESAPDGWEGTVKAMKKHKDIDNPYALAWSMKNKGYKSHKKEDIEETDIQELSTDLLGRYKKAAGDDATAADKAGDYDKGHKRFKGIVKATNKQFDNDAKKNK